MKNKIKDLSFKVQLRIYNLVFGYPKTPMSPELMLQHNKNNLTLQHNMEMEKTDNKKTNSVNMKYPALKLISNIYRVLSWIVAVLTIVISGSIIIGGEGERGIYPGIGVLVGGGVLFVTLLAIAEGIIVFVDIEHNTWVSARNSEK